jgi:GNAT superfamily N-acetyltransferase
MADTRCFCGAVIEAEDDTALVAAQREHFREVHDFDPGEAATLNAIERLRILGPVPERRLEIGEITVEPLSPDRADDYLSFFDLDAFTDNPGWASCYCMFHHVMGTEPPWEEWRWQATRAQVAARIASGNHRGFLAYEGERVVGWCNINARAEFPEHASGDESDEGTASAVCFVVAPAYRGYGLARRLLDAALEALPGQGYRRVEAYPVDSARNAAEAYKGTRAFYESMGFEDVGEGIVARNL